MSTKNSILVGIKVRPLLAKEKDQSSFWRVVNNSIQLTESQSDPYYFDHIFDYNANNEVVFEKMAKNIVHSAIKGFNGTIFAYGQTSSGKTYTMMGDDSNPGVMVLAAKEIFKDIERCSDRQFLLRVGCIEIYNEKIYDLFNKKNQDLKIHETQTGMVSVNCEEHIITSEEDMLQHLAMGNKERTVGETNMNERSSRSHAIFRIIVESRKLDRSEDDAVIQSVLNLVDLAGSERADQTGARGTRLKEGGHINKSLLFLSNVIKKLSENEDDRYISYRDSKLTRILQASLGGNALTSIICTIKSTTIEETQSTLSFAMRAKSIKNKPKVNEFVSDATMMKRLEGEIRDLKTRLDEERRKNESQKKVGELEELIKNEVLKIISCNSLSNIRHQREKRRRTWCSTSTNQEAQIMQFSTASAFTTSTATTSNGTTSRLPRLNVLLTPHITLRHTTEVDTAPVTHEITTVEELDEFTPGEFWDCNKLSPSHSPKTPTPEAGPQILQSKTITPDNSENLLAKLEIVERNLKELEEFTNLENRLDVKHDIPDALRKELAFVKSRNILLENERLEYIQMKEFYILLKQKLDDSEQRCNELQIKESELEGLYQSAQSTVRNYEEQLEELRETNNRLEMENRKAVCLEFEFERHKTKAEQRESELLEALKDKDNEILQLEQSLQAAKLVELGENEKRCDAAELEKLLVEISAVRGKLEDVQQKYQQLQCDYNSKSETCEALNRVVDATGENVRELQEKYDQLEATWLADKQAVAGIQADYDAVQLKYVSLQKEYEELGQRTAEDCARLQKENECLRWEINELKKRVQEAQKVLLTGGGSPLKSSNEKLNELKKQNESLQQELSTIRQQFDELQQECDDLSNQLMDSLQEGEALQDQMVKSHSRMKELEKERNTLRSSLELNNASFEAAKKATNDEICTLKCQLEAALLETKTCSLSLKGTQTEAIITESMYSSGLGSDREVMPAAEHAECFGKFMELLGILQEIELEIKGERRTFLAANAGRGLHSKLVLRNLQEIFLQQRNDSKITAMEGILSQPSFCIFELQEEDNKGLQAAGALSGEQKLSDSLTELKQQLQELTTCNERLRCEKNALVESTERTINEMREEISKLSAELFEKSTVMEDCQRQIESLERERAEMTLVFDELQDKIKDDSIISTSAKRTSLLLTMNKCAKEQVHDEVERLRGQEAKLQAELEMQTEMCQRKVAEVKVLRVKCVELEERCAQAETKVPACQKEYERKLSEVTKQLESKEKECKRLQLELYEKLELNEDEFRNNLRKYNREWEESKQNYESTIDGLHHQLEKYTRSFSQHAEATDPGTLLADLKEPLGTTTLDWETKAETLERKNVEQKAEEAFEKIRMSLQQSEEETKRLKALNEDLDKENSETRKALSEKLNALEVQNSELNTQLSKARESMQEAETRLQELNVKIGKLRDSKAELEAELHKALELNQEQANAESSLKRAVETLEKEKSEILQNLNETSRRSQEQSEEMARLQKESQVLREQMKDLSEQNSQYKREHKKACADLEDYLERVNGLQMHVDLAEKVRQQSLMEQTELVTRTQSDENTIKSLRMELAVAASLQEEKLELEKGMEKLRAQFESSVKALQQEVVSLQLSLDQQQKEKQRMADADETLRLKMESLSQELADANSKAKAYEQLRSEFESLQQQMHDEQQANKTLEHQVQTLEEQLRANETRGGADLLQLQKLQEELETAGAEREAAMEQNRTLQARLDSVSSKIAEQNSALEKQQSDFKSALGELQLNNESIQKTIAQLAAANEGLEQQLLATRGKAQDCAKLQAELEQSEARHSQLQTLLDKVVAKSSEEAMEQQKRLEEQTKSCHELRNSLIAKDAAHEVEREKLKRTIACLLSEKKSLEEKLQLTVVTLQSLESELTSLRRKSGEGNNSLDSLNNSFSPRRRLSFERNLNENMQLKSINVNVEDKLTAIQLKSKSQMENVERKNRRLSTHDERRRQSFWSVSRDVACMTDPTDASCNCVELDQKLKECEKKLFISESQVTTLGMALKSNPMKTENAVLIKRLKDEQEKNRAEAKKYEQLLAKQKAKTAAAVDSAVATALAKSKGPQSVEAPPKVVGYAETQTDFELDAAMQKLQSKYNDLKNICCSRYNRIKSLEEKVAQKEKSENEENVPISSLDAGRIKHLENQVESLKKELMVCTQKYTDAKIVLHTRRLEIQRLRTELGQTA